ncbi:MAG: hypothetical protein JKY32_13620 [Rhizobiales bacterium]|nr:hypothetical protein [Hyphomicrobiales bacterium]
MRALFFVAGTMSQRFFGIFLNEAWYVVFGMPQVFRAFDVMESRQKIYSVETECQENVISGKIFFLW